MKKTAIILPGQSSQYSKMGKTLYENFETVRKIYDEASECLGFDVFKLIDSGNMTELMKAPKLQPVILVTTYSYYVMCKEIFDIEPDYIVGHSLGEITALACAGIVDFKDAVEIAQMRGMFMQEVSNEIGEGLMVAVSEMDLAEIVKLCKQYQENQTPVYLANLNSNDQYVVSGLKKDMMPFIEDVKKAGGKAITLRVNIPFHCPYMKLAAEKFAEGLKKYTFKKGTCKIISNVTAKPYEEDEDIPLLLSKQIVSPVRWIESMNYLADNDVDVILEMGPGRILNKMTQSLSDKYLVSSLDNPKDDQFSLNIFNSKKLFNRNYLIERMMGVAVSEKNNNFDEKAYEEGVVKPYNKIRSLSDELEATGRNATVEDVANCADLLRGIFACKQISEETIAERMAQLIRETLITF